MHLFITAKVHVLMADARPDGADVMMPDLDGVILVSRRADSFLLSLSEVTAFFSLSQR